MSPENKIKSKFQNEYYKNSVVKTLIEYALNVRIDYYQIIFY